MTHKHGKKHREAITQLGDVQNLTPSEAFKKIKELAYAKFDESIDVNVNLGIDPTKGDQAVRGALVLPYVVGKIPRIIVFAKGEYSDQAEKAGADLVGNTDLIEKITKGWLDFDFAIATPDLMGEVGKLAKQLGPKGLLPNKKVGTVTFDVATMVKELKQGRVFFKNDKGGLVHFRFGKKSFNDQQLKENFSAFIKALTSAKPSSSKGQFITKITVASSMGVGVTINVADAMRSA